MVAGERAGGSELAAPDFGSWQGILWGRGYDRSQNSGPPAGCRQFGRDADAQTARVALDIEEGQELWLVSATRQAQCQSGKQTRLVVSGHGPSCRTTCAGSLRKDDILAGWP